MDHADRVHGAARRCLCKGEKKQALHYKSQGLKDDMRVTEDKREKDVLAEAALQEAARKAKARKEKKAKQDAFEVGEEDERMGMIFAMDI